MSYLTPAEFVLLSVMPESVIDEIEDAAPGWLDVQLEHWSRKIDSRLRKRYAVPFGDPAPLAVRGWLASIVTHRAYLRRGVDPLDPQAGEIKADADAAWAEIREAADSETGLFELPMIATSTATGITRGGPFGYSEASPYVGHDVQRRIGREEDQAGEGSYG